jgi:methylase of polypeptide subunit release factors
MLISYCSRLARKRKPALRILDLGTGTGCIALLLLSRLWKHYELKIVGIDTSPKAIRLAKRNLRQAVASGVIPQRAAQAVSFCHDDMTHESFARRIDWHHVVVCNPPYISSAELRSTTERSVRLYEPREALVADEAVDDSLTVYEKALAQWIRSGKSDICLVEFVDERRALLFIDHVKESYATWNQPRPRSSPNALHFEIWREGIAFEGASHEHALEGMEAREKGLDPVVKTRGTGPVRAVVGYSGSNRLHDSVQRP